MTKLNVLNLFANAGIGETYLSNLNLNVVLANELLPERCSIFKRLHPQAEVIQGDITLPSIFSNVLEKAIEKEVNVIIATPPCQGMSQAGKMEENDVRNLLITKAMQMFENIKPEFMVVENVTGALKSFIKVTDDKESPYFGPDLIVNGQVIANDGRISIVSYIQKVLEQTNKQLPVEDHYLLAENKTFNAENYGTPQSRLRAFFRIYKRKYQWVDPVPQEKITLKEVIGHLPSIEATQDSGIYLHRAPKASVNHLYWMKHTASACSAYGNFIHRPLSKVRPQSSVFDTNGSLDSLFDEFGAFKHKADLIKNQKTGEYLNIDETCQYEPTTHFYKEEKRLIKGFYTAYKRIDWHKPAPTVTMGNGSISSQNNVHPGRFVSVNEQGVPVYSDARVLSWHELMLVMGLVPGEWNPFVDSDKPYDMPEKLFRHIIGEAVAPLMMYELIKPIVEFINGKIVHRGVPIMKWGKLIDRMEYRSVLKKNLTQEQIDNLLESFKKNAASIGDDLILNSTASADLIEDNEETEEGCDLLEQEECDSKKETSGEKTRNYQLFHKAINNALNDKTNNEKNIKMSNDINKNVATENKIYANGVNEKVIVVIYIGSNPSVIQYRRLDKRFKAGGVFVTKEFLIEKAEFKDQIQAPVIDGQNYQLSQDKFLIVSINSESVDKFSLSLGALTTEDAVLHAIGKAKATYRYSQPSLLKIDDADKFSLSPETFLHKEKEVNVDYRLGQEQPSIQVTEQVSSFETKVTDGIAHTEEKFAEIKQVENEGLTLSKGENEFLSKEEVEVLIKSVLNFEKDKEDRKVRDFTDIYLNEASEESDERIVEKATETIHLSPKVASNVCRVGGIFANNEYLPINHACKDGASQEENASIEEKIPSRKVEYLSQEVVDALLKGVTGGNDEDVALQAEEDMEIPNRQYIQIFKNVHSRYLKHHDEKLEEKLIDLLKKIDFSKVL